MFRRTIAAAARSPYTVFMMQNTKNPVLAKLSFTKRQQKVTAMYHALNPKEKATLVAKAAKAPSFKRKPSKQAAAQAKLRKAGSLTGPKKPSAYNKFVKANINKQAGKTLGEKMKGVAKLWKAAKKVSKK